MEKQKHLSKANEAIKKKQIKNLELKMPLTIRSNYQCSKDRMMRKIKILVYLKIKQWKSST